MTDSASLSWIDYSGEVSGTRINIPDVTGANFAAQETALANLQTVIAGLIIGNDYNRGFTVNTRDGSGAPASPLAQREVKWLVGFKATSPANEDFGRNYTIELPTADLTLLAGGDDILWKAPSPKQAFVQAFTDELELTAVSPEGSNIQVTYIRFVGRNI